MSNPLLIFIFRFKVAVGYKLQSIGRRQKTVGKSQFISLCTVDLTLYIEQTAVTRIRCVDSTVLSEKY
jgi:hypothetical protein